MTEPKWNQEEIELHLASAVNTLTPDVLSRIDLNTPQKIYTGPSKAAKLYRRIRSVGMAAAACLCAVVLGSGVTGYFNSRVESVIGIDVNPSIELSVNRKEKVLKAEPLNSDAEIILDDMDLKDVDLDIAVNALIGSMVRNGYLTELDNAILVTVSNEDRAKASVLRQDVVIDIEESLEAHQVQAVVYDQQVPEDDRARELSEEYEISYGKAYFLQELVAENDLTQADLEMFAGMTMEEIAREIAERSYTVRKDGPDSMETEPGGQTQAQQPGKTAAEETGGPENGMPAEESTEAEEAQEKPAEESAAEQAAESAGAASEMNGSGNGGNVSQTKPSETAAQDTAASNDSETGEEEDADSDTSGKKARIDYVDYEAGSLDVIFEDKVKWKNPTVSVQDDLGQSYSAMITDTSSDSCEIIVRGLPGGVECSFTLAGVAPKDGKTYGSIKGYFETPEIAEEAEPNLPDGVEPEEEEEDNEAEWEETQKEHRKENFEKAESDVDVTVPETAAEAESEEKENAAETPAAKDAESAEMVD